MYYTIILSYIILDTSYNNKGGKEEQGGSEGLLENLHAGKGAGKGKNKNAVGLGGG